MVIIETPMKRTRFVFYAVAGATLTAAFWFISQPQQRLENEPLHAAMEAVEALSVLLLAFLLLSRKEEGDKLVLPALGFLGMGILDVVHAVSWPGQQFVFLKAAASLAGGMGFCLVWLPVHRFTAVSRAWLSLVVIAGSFALCAWPFLSPADFPVMARDGEFTVVAVAINLLAGFLFLAGTLRFTIGRYSDRPEDLLFSLIGIFFSLSCLTFRYSMLWSESWWYWHVMRLAASLLVLGFIVHGHLRAIAALKASLIERRRVEEALKQSEGELGAIIENAPVCVTLVAEDGTLLRMNRAGLEIIESDAPSQVQGKNIYPLVAAKYRQAFVNLAKEVFQGKPGTLEFEAVSLKGKKLWLTTRGVPLFDNTGRVKAFQGITLDVTRRKLAELERERLVEELQRSNKELEQFASVASHDLQEPLRVISGFAHLVQKRYKGKLDKKGEDFIGRILDGSFRMHRLIKDLLEYSRVTTTGRPFKLVDCNEILQKALANLKVAVEEAGAVITADPLPVVAADEMQLVSLFQNLVGNAVKYRKKEEPSRIHLSAGTVSERWEQTGCTTGANRLPAGSWILSVRDNGIGIESRSFERIFQIFQRLHSSSDYPGTGVGLAICKKIVERHGGCIWVESERGKGSSFFFTLPERSVDETSVDQAQGTEEKRA